jgi:surface polysaccharide O-acyltransferase-like enzyme
LNRDHPWRATLTEAVFPFYIFHQTWLIVLTQVLRPLNLPTGLEATVIVLLTFVLSGLSYVLVRRIGVLRMWFGMAPAPIGRTPTR